WTLTSKPAGSTAILSSATSAMPTFTADVAGAYVASLFVNDGKVSSTVSTVTVNATVENAAPVANAGVAQNITTGNLVTLNGSNSSDANGDALTYSWSLTSKPVGSTAILSSATSAMPTFTADVAGAYVASVVVNDGKVSSTVSIVTVNATVANAAPVANAGVAQNITAGNLVTLNGSNSSDANNDALTFIWTLTSKPAGSTAILSSATSAMPTFTADVAGAYVASLFVNDGKVSSTVSTVTVNATVENAAPVANAGVAQNITAGNLVTLNGSNSSDANNDALTFIWTLTSKPAGSTAILRP
ncbi:PKD domain-containing protein, partial [Limnohabitans sp. WS1]|uniref:PKD domain-containing protein n=1 Tax=Limnohabitans sp. WS1 TaxID=1100726 RepID=UPI0018EE9944